MGKASARKKKGRENAPPQNEAEGKRMLDAWLANAAAETRNETARAWAVAQTAETIKKIFTQLHATAEANTAATYQSLQQLKQAGQGDLNIDCKEGCNWCCFSEVSASAPEVILIAEHLREVMTAEELASLRERLSARSEESQGLTEEGKVALRRPCPFLVDGRCSIYSVRPFTCRTHNSRDVNACRRFHEGERVPIPQVVMMAYATQPLVQGMEAAFTASGRNVESLWFYEALELALSSDAGKEWCEGKNPFAGVSKAAYEARLQQRYRDEGLLSPKAKG